MPIPFKRSPLAEVEVAGPLETEVAGVEGQQDRTELHKGMNTENEAHDNYLD